MRKAIAAVLVALCATAASAAGPPACRNDDSAARARMPLQHVMAHGRFVAYQPTALQIIDGRATNAGEASIADDLTVLRSRFDSLITYSALHGAERVPDVAMSLGFNAVIVGVWDVTDATEIANAIAAWRRHPRLVVGVSLGNEVVLGKRGDFVSLGNAIDAVRRQAPGLALSTTEPFHLFYDAAAAPVLSRADFLLVNVHPIFQPWFSHAPDTNAAEFVVNVVDDLARIYCGPILVKETGVPTAPQASGYSESRQATFYQQLRDRFVLTPLRAFSYFSAFDAPWRVNDSDPVPGYHPEEAHWGLYDERRKPKAVVAVIPTLSADVP